MSASMFVASVPVLSPCMHHNLLVHYVALLTLELLALPAQNRSLY